MISDLTAKGHVDAVSMQGLPVFRACSEEEKRRRQAMQRRQRAAAASSACAAAATQHCIWLHECAHGWKPYSAAISARLERGFLASARSHHSTVIPVQLSSRSYAVVVDAAHTERMLQQCITEPSEKQCRVIRVVMSSDASVWLFESLHHDWFLFSPRLCAALEAAYRDKRASAFALPAHAFSEHEQFPGPAILNLKAMTYSLASSPGRQGRNGHIQRVPMATYPRVCSHVEKEGHSPSPMPFAQPSHGLSAEAAAALDNEAGYSGDEEGVEEEEDVWEDGDVDMQ